MNQTALSVLLGACLVAGAILYSNGTFDREPPVPAYEAAVKARLLDPDSAVFRDVVQDTAFQSHFGEYMYCGEVNSRNRLGGFAGWQQFIAKKDHDTGVWKADLQSDMGTIGFPFWCS